MMVRAVLSAHLESWSHCSGWLTVMTLTMTWPPTSRRPSLCLASDAILVHRSDAARLTACNELIRRCDGFLSAAGTAASALERSSWGPPSAARSPGPLPAEAPWRRIPDLSLGRRHEHWRRAPGPVGLHRTGLSPECGHRLGGQAGDARHRHLRGGFRQTREVRVRAVLLHAPPAAGWTYD